LTLSYTDELFDKLYCPWYIQDTIEDGLGVLYLIGNRDKPSYPSNRSTDEI